MVVIKTEWGEVAIKVDIAWAMLNYLLSLNWSFKVRSY